MVFYFVQRGETLYAVAKRYQTTVHAIVVANRLEDPNAICPGQALIIPRPGEVPSPPPGGIVHLVRAGETIFTLGRTFGASPQEILRANQVAHPEFILPGQQLVIPEQTEAREDWPMLGRTPGRAGSGPVVLEGAPVEGWTFAPRRNAGVKPSAPVIRYDRVYVGLGDGQFHAICRESGRVKWRVAAGDTESLTLLGDHALATPAVYDGLAYLAGPDGVMKAVDAHSGRPVWKVITGGPITSSPAVWDGLVYFGSWDEHLYALEAKTGAIVWRRHVAAPIYQPVAVGDDHLFVVSADGLLWALGRETGDVYWKASGDGDGSPVFAEVVLLTGGRAYDPTNGEVLWDIDTSGTWPVSGLDQVIFPGGTVDLFTGALLRSPVPGHVGASGGRECVPPPPVPVVRSHVATGAMLLGVGDDRRLHAWDPGNGKVHWTAELNEASEQPPGVARGQVVVSLADGSVRTYRFKQPGEK